MVVSSQEREAIDRLSASLTTAAIAGGGESKTSDSRPVGVAGVVGQGKAIVAKGVSFSFSISISLSLVQSADVLVGGTTSRVSLVQPIA